MPASLLTPDLGRAGGTATTSVTTGTVTPGTANVILLQVSVRAVGTVITPSGVASTWTAVGPLRTPSQAQFSTQMFLGTGTLTAGAIAVGFNASVTTAAALAYGLVDTDPADPFDPWAVADTGATDTNAPAVTFTPENTGDPLLGLGTSRNQNLTSARAGYSIVLNNFQVSTSGNMLSLWSVQATSASATGVSTTAGGTLGGAIDWDIYGLAVAPGASVDPPKAGSATGTWSFTGAAAGRRAPKSSLAGTWTFTSSVTGKKAQRGSAAGAWSFAGAVSGSAPVVVGKSGTATGTWTFTGAAAGRRAPRAQAAGTWVFTSALAGKTSRRGAAAGGWGFTSNLVGKTQHRGSASGAWSFGSALAGLRVSSGAAAGSLSWSTIGFTGSNATTITVVKPSPFVLHRNRVLVHIGAGLYR